MKRLAKRGILITLAVMLLFTTPVMAASKKQKAMKAYARFLSKSILYQDRYHEGRARFQINLKSPYCRCSIIYLNKDSIPELMIMHPSSHAEGYGSLYTYYKGKVRFVSKIDSPSGYYKKKAVLPDAYSNQGTINITYYYFNGKNLTPILYQGGHLDYNDNVSWRYFNKKQKQISRSKFNILLKKRIKRTKSRSMLFWRNTADNREKYLK